MLLLKRMQGVLIDPEPPDTARGPKPATTTRATVEMPRGVGTASRATDR